MNRTQALAQILHGFTAGNAHQEVCHRGGNVVVAAVGEASLAGYMIREYVAKSAYVYVSDDYLIPEGVVSPTSLVMVISLDGEDDAMISAFHHARRLGLDTIVMTSGGRLMELAKEHGAVIMQLPRLETFDAPLYLLGLLTGIMQKVCILHGQESVVQQAQGFIEDRIGEIQLEAKRLSSAIHGQLPVFYGGTHTACLARLMKSYINVYAKMPAFFGELPVSLYDEMVGYQHATQDIAVVAIRSAYDYERIRRSLEVLEEAVVEKQHITFHRIHLIGNSWFEEMVYGMVFAQELIHRIAEAHQIDLDDHRFRHALIDETR